MSTLVMGVVNVTPDSFSDGGEWFEPDAAVAHGLQLLEQGADLLDVGGESTRPGAERSTEQEELRRVLPVVAELVAARCAGLDRHHARRGRRPAAARPGPAWSTTSAAAWPTPAMAAVVADSGVHVRRDALARRTAPT